MGIVRNRIAVAALSLSIAGLAAWKANEGYTSVAVIPTQGDVPTIGHGSTRWEDGTAVRLGDTITPARADVLARNLASQDEKRLAASLPGVKLYPEEFDLYLNWIGQFGIGNWLKPKSPRTWLVKGDYRGACDALLNWRYSAGYDCSTTINGKRNKRCWGVWTRQLDRHAQCLAVQ